MSQLRLIDDAYTSGVDVDETNDRYTPGWLLNIARQMTRGDFSLDVASPRTNPTRSIVYCTRAGTFHRDLGLVSSDTGLEFSWVECTSGRDECGWANWPWGRGCHAQWLGKLYEASCDGAEFQILTLADVRTQWYRTLITEVADSYVHLNRNVGFVQPDGKPLPGMAMGCMVSYVGPRRRMFREVWGDEGFVYDAPGRSA